MTSVSVLVRRWRHGRARPSWSFLHELLAAVMKREFARLATRSWKAQRENWNAHALPDPTRFRTRRTERTIAGVSCIVVEPRRVAAERTILFSHGGAYCIGAMAGYAETFGRLALAASARIIAPVYRLAPEHPFPCALDDVFAVYRAVLDEVPPANLVLAGDSAGGGITAATLLRARDEGCALPAGAVLISPWVDLAAEGGSLAAHEPFDFFSPRSWRAGHRTTSPASTRTIRSHLLRGPISTTSRRCSSSPGAQR